MKLERDLCPFRRYFETSGSAICNAIMIVYTWQEEETYLAHYGDLLAVFETNRALVTFRVIKYNGYTGFGDACLTVFVYEVLLVLSMHLDVSSET
jgi:hypothetical protein